MPCAVCKLIMREIAVRTTSIACMYLIDTRVLVLQKEHEFAGVDVLSS